MRILWLGNHKILVKTELPRLRELGYEVFNPPYLAPGTLHQSISKDWDADQPTTLPRDVFDKLGNYSFFFNEITPEIEGLINQYFDAVIVTIDPGWLIETLRAFKGKIIYRTYGHVINMSEHLWAQDAFRMIAERDNFYVVPHSAVSQKWEHHWLRERQIVVPYVPTQDVTDILDTSDPFAPKEKEIMISCPNLSNPGFKAHYDYLKQHFYQSHFKFYGVQPQKYEDPQIVGTIPFDRVLKRYTEAAGFLYTYRNPAVCFLPPIEMMIAGGPVIFLSGSLLDQYFGYDAPGRAVTEEEARDKCQRLMDGDQEFIRAVVESQKPVRDLYLPRTVWPIFDRVFKELLDPQASNRGRRVTEVLSDRDVTFILSHIEGNPVHFEGGEYRTDHPELLAVRREVQRILAEGKQDVVLTCRKDQVPMWYGLFLSGTPGDRVRLLTVDRKLAREAIKQDYSIYQSEHLRDRGVVNEDTSKPTGEWKTVIAMHPRAHAILAVPSLEAEKVGPAVSTLSL